MATSGEWWSQKVMVEDVDGGWGQKVIVEEFYCGRR